MPKVLITYVLPIPCLVNMTVTMPWSGSSLLLNEFVCIHAPDPSVQCLWCTKSNNLTEYHPLDGNLPLSSPVRISTYHHLTFPTGDPTHLDYSVTGIQSLLFSIKLVLFHICTIFAVSPRKQALPFPNTKIYSSPSSTITPPNPI